MFSCHLWANPLAAVGEPSVSIDVGTQLMTNAVGAACKRLWGRGPRYVRLWFAGDDTVVLLLTGILTDAERSLLAVDRDSTVMSTRAALHRALEPEVRVILETTLGRETHAFVAGIDVDHDLASLVITLQ
jgi:uncharacterized protein YbcI